MLRQKFPNTLLENDKRFLMFYKAAIHAISDEKGLKCNALRIYLSGEER